MPSINNWAAKAARRIFEETTANREIWTSSGQAYREECIAAIIATFAEPLVVLLQETKREHTTGCLTHRYQTLTRKCTCGADAWNKKIDEALS